MFLREKIGSNSFTVKVSEAAMMVRGNKKLAKKKIFFKEKVNEMSVGVFEKLGRIPGNLEDHACVQATYVSREEPRMAYSLITDSP